MTTIHSFSELRAAYLAKHPDAQIEEPKPKKERERKCKVCGSVLEHKPGTNVWICHGEIEVPDKNDPEKMVKEPCGNFVLSTK